MNVFVQEYAIPREGLSARYLFWLLQESAGGHSSSLGFGEAELRAMGVMWVVVRYYVEVSRWPKAGEHIRVETWPGQSRHGMCPRFYRFLDAAGAQLLSASALWAVVDRESRQLVSPHERGVDIEPLQTGMEARLPGTIRRPVTDHEVDFVVPPDYLDGNGHMNNTCYFDLAENCTGLRAAECGLKTVTAEYLNEALCGEHIRVRWGMEGNCCTVVGEAESGHVFRMKLEYGA